MNEVTKIHLGRQAFAISTEAHHELRRYLDAIKRYVSDDDVLGEIEMRMAELLGERGVQGEKVILPADVTFLKGLLGDPKDFAEDETTETINKIPVDTGKRLFRDTDNGMLAGVAAGLASYFGIDALIVRLLFVIATFAGGWGILIYLVLWLLVPPANTPSERLQMAGKAVTIDNLKDVVERADIKGAAARANHSLAAPITGIVRFILRIIGTVFVVVGVGTIISIVSGTLYFIQQDKTWTQYNIFPMGFSEHVLVYIVAAVITIIAIFIVLFGLAVFRRRWPVRAWITGTLIGLLLIGIAISSVLTADVAPQVHDRYNTNLHTSIVATKPFTKIDMDNMIGAINVEYQTSNTYSVHYQYYGNANIDTIKTTVTNQTLNVDTQHFNWTRSCPTLCFPNTYNLTITVYSPEPPETVNPPSSEKDGDTSQFYTNPPATPAAPLRAN